MAKDDGMPVLFHLHNERLDGTLTERLTQWAAEGATLQEITFKLRELDVEVSPPTVMRWMDRLGIERSRERGEARYNAPSTRGAA